MKWISTALCGLGLGARRRVDDSVGHSVNGDPHFGIEALDDRRHVCAEPIHHRSLFHSQYPAMVRSLKSSSHIHPRNWHSHFYHGYCKHARNNSRLFFYCVPVRMQ